MAECRDCTHAAIQFGEFTGQRSYLRCRLSGYGCGAERERIDGCGPSGRFFVAFVPLRSDEFTENGEND